MGEKRTQPGGRVDKETYERFREFVREKHGAIRGNLGTELTKAMEDRMDVTHENSKLTRIENDVATIKAQLSEVESDGGDVVSTLSETNDTRARRSGKPAANQSRDKKIEYLLDECLDGKQWDRDSGELTAKDLRNTIETEYSFKEEIVDEYVDAALVKLEAKKHPIHGNTWVWGHRFQEARDKQRKQRKQEVDEKL